MPPDTRIHVEYESGSRQILVPLSEKNQSLADILRRHDLPLNTRCGQRGLCEGCVVNLTNGAVRNLITAATISPNAATGNSADDNPAGTEIRACQCAPASHSLHIHIPARSLLAYQPHVVSDFKLNITAAHDPLYKPTSHRNPTQPLGIAIDIGTTTVAALLVDLLTAQPLAKASSFNRQMHLGDNVLTRINLCQSDPAMVAQLQHAVVQQTIQPLIDQLIATAVIQPDQIVCITAAGNSTMQHLLLGVDPSSMGVAPFTPTFLEHRLTSARSVGINLDADLHLLPGAAAYIGADLCAGVVSSGLLYEQGPSLLVDVGTNGEIILKVGDQLLGCATAAGPAFEGAGLSSGVRAGDGAISHIQLSTAPFTIHTDVINNGKTPLGICGSAYIDFLAEARRINLLSITGRFDPQHPATASSCIQPFESYGRAIRLAHGQGKRDILISEPDIASLLQAKAAIAAGIRILLKQACVSPHQLKTLHLAGGFGMNLLLPSAIGSGLLPDIRLDQVQLVGNTSLGGAYLAMIDAAALNEMSRVGRDLRIVELNLDPDFESTYIDELMLP